MQGAEGIIELSDEADAKALGLRWITATDELTFRAVIPCMPKWPTKRQVLSEVAKLYDPNGFLAPIIINAKLMIQDLWHVGIEWDEKIPESMCVKWCEFYDTLDQLQQVKVPRWMGMRRTSKVQLHGFADASQRAYGAVIYVCITDATEKVQCYLVTSKSRVAPSRTLTIPRLELAAAELLSRLMQHTIGICEFHHPDVFLWSDSEIVLCWLRKAPHDLKTFVANRVAKVQTITSSASWAHVSSTDNPADLLSRGMSMEDFVQSSHWFHGPKWLTEPVEHWPVSKFSQTDQIESRAAVECKPQTTEHLVGMSTIKLQEIQLLQRYSSWNKVMRITAYVFRFIDNCRATRQSRTEGSMITHAEIQRATEHWVKSVQAEHYKAEIQARQDGDVMPSKSKIIGLNPCLNEQGVLCVGGRLSKANLPHQQFIIPSRSRLGWLLMDKAHKETLHGGAQAMMAYIRSAYWIPRLRSESRMYIGRCAKCFRMAEKTATQLMGNLPADRVQPARPFYKAGVDFAGPFDIKLRPGRPTTRASEQSSAVTSKGYVAVFVCMVTRAIHLEAVMGMTSEAFIAAFRRFVARRGHCAHMYSDNGTNFVGANTEMKEAVPVHGNTVTH